jgi:hypothetical protein
LRKGLQKYALTIEKSTRKLKQLAPKPFANARKPISADICLYLVIDHPSRWLFLCSNFLYFVHSPL